MLSNSLSVSHPFIIVLLNHFEKMISLKLGVLINLNGSFFKPWYTSELLHDSSDESDDDNEAI